MQSNIAAEISKFIDRVIDRLRAKARASMDKTDPECTFEEMWKNMDADERNTFPNFQKKKFMQEEFPRRIRDNPKVMFFESSNTFKLKKRFADAYDLVKKLHHERSGVEDKEDLHDDVPRGEIDGLIREGFLRLVEIKENKSKTTRVLLSKNLPEDPVEQLNLEESTPVELISYWDEFAKNAQQQESSKRDSAHHFLYRDPKMTIKQHLGKRKRRFFDDTDVSRWQNQHLIDKIEDALDVLEKQVAPELRTLKRNLKKGVRMTPR